MNHQFITKDNLEALGIDLSNRDVDALLTELNNALQERVSVEITESLNGEQLQELLEIQETASADELTAWLERHVPNLQQVVQEEIDVILGELADENDVENQDVA